MVFSLLKKDFLIVKKYVLLMIVLIFLIPPFVQSRTPEFTGVLGFILSVIYVVLMLLQYESLKEYQYPKAATLLCATPFSRKAIVLSKYIFCMVIYFICCIAYEIETLIIPGLGTADVSLFAFMFLVTSVFVGLYLPVQYKLGYEKTRFTFMVVIIASPIILPLLMRMESLNMDFLSTLSSYLICVGIIFVGFVVLAISASLSMKIYEKTDLA